jgi:hypothetical protein
VQIGIDSFAAAFDETSLAVSPSDRLRDLVEQIEHADQVGRTSSASGNTIVGNTSTLPLRSSLEQQLRGRAA